MELMSVTLNRRDVQRKRAWRYMGSKIQPAPQYEPQTRLHESYLLWFGVGIGDPKRQQPSATNHPLHNLA
jgi:hypothetical protein